MNGSGKTVKLDPRVVRTRQLIREAFVDLLGEIDVEKITVNRITERATINRVTFYLHYKDIPDMLEKMADDIISEMQEAIRGADEQPSEVLVVMLEHIAENAKLFKLLLATKRVPVFTERFLSVTIGMISSRIEHRLSSSAQTSVPADIGTWYLTSAIIGTIIFWLRNDMPYRPAFLAKQIIKMAPHL
ncbi:TetR family transcriptional regulator C-terminal domain-containing protein [Paenibacillus athensensis]|uniref:TetR family transcriptional regulator n=1 Tax=Paenibacillus athensensis TaxID=1967502 RepID=A0A4Y8Q1B6_9BACL|nr:TetR-like C-terminal domain-containing protein [Paenibacillus athensensis]MCD1260390.1 TetR family transcriptional regulator C-terminal domain-containing protein [Paenibacillus athensensis]